MIGVKTYRENSVTINTNKERYLLSLIYNNYYFEVLNLSNLNNNFYYSSLLSVPDSLYIYSYVNSLFKLKNE